MTTNPAATDHAANPLAETPVADTPVTDAPVAARAALPAATIVGYPRIGPDRELKKAAEAFWAGRITREDYLERAARLRDATRRRLAALGLDRDGAIPESFSHYDQVLDAALTVGAIPARFPELTGRALEPTDVFVLARGTAEQGPLEMTKWFDTNYHYLVPEIGPDTAFHLAFTQVIDLVAEARAEGLATRPVIVGPLTLLLLAKPEAGSPEGFTPLDRLEDLLPVYAELLTRLHAAGAEHVQLDEPALVVDHELPQSVLEQAVARAHGALAAVQDRPSILVTTPYGDATSVLPALLGTGVEAIHLDLARGPVPSVEQLAGVGATRLVAGLIDGRTVWRADLATAAARLEQLRERIAAAGGDPSALSVSTSVSLQHVPHRLADEQQLGEELLGVLAFAEEKVQEVVALAAGTVPPGDPEGPRSVSREHLAGVRDDTVRARTAALQEADRRRAPWEDRAAAQRARLGLPLLPTTTIGSFPQTAQVRTARAAYRAGRSSLEAYTAAMHAEIDRVIALQEELGLDVLVHGEPERNDMVQYFAELLDGFVTTRNGWVQSYGSRCTRPSILVGDVSRPEPMTVPWTQYAASRTTAPVKGMLTGPVTILAWSFVRDDQPLAETADQIALALRDEISDLEAAGVPIIQVDEPALRELLPLRRAEQDAYLAWSVGAFRLATAGARPDTQIHTHLCYSEFNEIIDAIDGLDADVTSIESARSQGEVIAALDPERFGRGIGPGVWDIHSPRVPSVEEISALLHEAVAHLDPQRIWVNPDCGLKTRAYEETRASLTHLVEAARRVREGSAQLAA